MKEPTPVDIKDDYCVICILRFGEIDRRSQHPKQSLRKFKDESSDDYINICEDCWQAIRITGIFKPMEGLQRFRATKPIDSILDKRGKRKSHSTPLKQSD